MVRNTSKKILADIGCQNLNLYKGDGYWYFVYYDVVSNKYDTHMEYTMYLNSMPEKRWVEIGRNFILKVLKDL
jgi:hypothetical protein